MSESPRPSLAWPELLISLGLLGFAGLVWWQTATMAVSPMYAKVGPTVFPYMTAAGLAVLAAFLFGFALRGGWQPEDEKEVAIDWPPVAFVTAGLVLNVGLIQSLGFTLASTILFVLVSWGFGSRRPLRDAAIGFVFALVSFFGFAKALGVNIGGGWFETLLGA
ncbi:tripartite tricarboxylate transporter TctB family protein [Alsobacter sp. R-9]